MSEEKKAPKAPAPPAQPRRDDPPGVITMHGVRPWERVGEPPTRKSGAPPDKMLAIGGPSKIRISNPAAAAKVDGEPKA